jgi:hypothetical protein
VTVLDSMIVSVSDLESFRRYSVDEDFPLEVLLRQLRRLDEPNEKMRAGTALHSILENACELDVFTRIEQDGFTFRFDCDGELPLPTVRELRGQRAYQANGAHVILKGRVDDLDGMTVEDHKFTGQFDAQGYGDSLQWRAYLSIFGATRFIYNVFVGDKEERTGEWVVKDFHRLPLYRYPEMESDLVRWIGRYVDFARTHLQIAA